MSAFVYVRVLFYSETVKLATLKTSDNVLALLFPYTSETLPTTPVKPHYTNETLPPKPVKHSSLHQWNTSYYTSETPLHQSNPTTPVNTPLHQ